MKKYLKILLAVPVFAFYLSNAQKKISGSITDNKHHVLQGVSIAIKDSYDWATTDSTGRFSITTSASLPITLQFSSVGYKDAERVISNEGPAFDLQITLQEKIGELDAVVISAGSYAAGDKKKGVVLSKLDVLTTAQNGDISTAIKMLPGAQQIGEQEGLFVRGGTGYETKQYMDGAVISNPYFSGATNISQRGRFSPFLFSGTVFSSGGYSAVYGDALSSVLLLESNDLPRRSEINATISSAMLALGTQHLAKNKRMSYGINYKYTDVSPYYRVVKQKPDFFAGPRYHSLEGNVKYKTKSGGMIKIFSSFNNNMVGLRSQDVDSQYYKDVYEVFNNSWYTNWSWKENLSNGWKLQWANSLSLDIDKINTAVVDQQNHLLNFGDTTFWMQAKSGSVNNKQNNVQSKLILEKRYPGFATLRFGSEYDYSLDRLTYNNEAHELRDNSAAVFGETDYYLSKAVALKIGLRTEYSSLLKQVNIAPRISAAYKLSPRSQVSFAYGKFYQKPENIYLMYNSGLEYTKATHYILNFQRSAPGQLFRVEGFYKDYQDLIKAGTSVTGNIYNNDGKGYARGVEVFWRDKINISGFDYWVSYSYLDTKRDYLNYTQMLRPSFAAEHTASIVLKRFFEKLKTQFNFTYSYASGRPYYNIINETGSPKYMISDYGKTIDYNNVGFSVNYLPNVMRPAAKANIIIVASVTNLLGSKQVFGYNYSYSGQYKQPVEPLAKRSFFLGVFINWGVDRTQDIINNNL